MAKRTQKAGATAKFGARYGVSVRRNSAGAMKKKSQLYTCPVCQYKKVKRKSVGIWHCDKCNHTFTGGAWEPYTRATTANQRITRRNMEGASDTDLLALAAQAAIDFEAMRAEEAGDDSDEEE
ncbi:MAG: 50S ribosomal protein L37ae [Methanobacteriota archaeon]|nr:MAG: 50S ribosomal protein L37ae [Euryarchaeota archaeon]|tara:strand:+ start:1671 stop:2039 length:369 start_codon:yes stop_codon:yes gene_type:complete